MEIYKQNYRLDKSKIHGIGVYSNKKFKKGDIIGIGIIFKLYFIPIITDDFGIWLNHSYDPNSYLYYCPVENIYYIIAKVNIPNDTEITMNYRDTPWYIKKPEVYFK